MYIISARDSKGRCLKTCHLLQIMAKSIPLDGQCRGASLCNKGYIATTNLQFLKTNISWFSHLISHMNFSFIFYNEKLTQDFDILLISWVQHKKNEFHPPPLRSHMCTTGWVPWYWPDSICKWLDDILNFVLNLY